MSSRNPKPITVVIVDDHAVIREGLRMLIEGRPDMKVVGEASNSRDAIEAAGREQPDIILLDVDLGGEDGLESVAKLLAVSRNSKVLILTGSTDQETHARAVRLGAMGLVGKEKAGGVLLKAIEKVHGGEIWFDRSVMGSMLSEMSRGEKGKKISPEAAKIATLTERELEVVARLCEGLKNKQIADRLCISETTVRHHLTSIFGKLGVEDRLELLVFAFRHKLADLPGEHTPRRDS